MKFRCNAAELTEAVLSVIRVMAVRSPMEILQGVLLDADETGINVTASDGSMTSTCRVNAEIDTDGSAVLPGRLLSDILRKLPNGEMNASLSNRFVLTIRCEGSRFNIAGRSAEEFPIPDETGFNYELNLPQPLLKDMIHQTSFAVPLEDQRVVLTGGYLNLEQGNLDLVGLDGFRMAVRSEKISDVLLSAKAIIPGKALDEIERLMSDDENDMVNMKFSQNRLLVQNGKTKLFTSLIEGQYIDYKRVIPQSFTLTANVETESFVSCVDRAALIARTGKNNLVKLEISEGLIVFSASSEAGDVREELSAQTHGGDLSISFNVKYLSELARVMKGGEIQLKFGTSTSPCVICPGEGNEFTFLVLPVRTNG